MTVPLSQRFSGEEDASRRSSLSLLFNEEPVDLQTFIKDRKFLGQSTIDLSPVQAEAVSTIERVYYADLYPRMGEEFGSSYWAKELPMKNLITLQWGKGCLLAGEEIYDASSGQWIAVESAQAGTTAAATGSGKVVVRERSASFYRGRGEAFKVTTATGLSVKVYGGHQFLTRDGYQQLRKLSVGDSIAQVVTLPIENPVPMDPREVELIGWWLGDGIMPSGKSGLTMMFSENETESMSRYADVCASLGIELTFRQRENKKCWYVSSTRNSGYKRQNPLMEIARRCGLRGKTAHNVRVPKEIFSLPNNQVALFLSRLWTTDGHVYASKNKDSPNEAGYVSVSEGMVRDVQRLLLRLGISSEIRSRLVSGFNVTTTAWEVRLRTAADLRAFCEKVPLLDKWKSQNKVLDSLDQRVSRANRNREGDLRYSKIASIEELGEHDYYDLTVGVDHNYIAAGGLVNHNSGKDAIARFSSLRVAYLLLCLKNPQEYFGIPEFDSIHLLNIAANSGQANQAFFKPMTEAVKRGWFKDHAEPKQGLIQYNKNIVAISGHSDAEGQEGLNIMLGVADEIDAFRAKNEMVGVGKRAREASTSAESILKMLKGSAAAQPLDAKVLTPSGWTNMGELKVGDPVVDPMGDSTSVVTGIFPQGVTPVYELTFSDKSVTRASHHHLWEIEYSWTPTTLAARASKESKSVRKTVTTDWLVENLPKFQRWNRPIKIIPTNIGESDFHLNDLTLDPYLLGALLGDGGLTHHTPTFTSADQQMFELVSTSLPAGVTFSDFIQHTGCRSVRLVHGKGKKNPLTAELERLGVWGKHSYDKFIPEDYKWASSNDRLALLQGLLDTDGTVGKTGADFTSTSERLALDVRDLARSLGLSARIFAPQKPSTTSTWVSSEVGRIQGKRLSWKVSIGRSREVNLFRLDRKVEKQPTVRTQRHSYSLRAITRIEDDVTQCIMVSADSHLYVTDDWIVTHNTRFPQTYKRVTISYPRYLGSTIQQQTAEGLASIKKYGDQKSQHYVSGPLATWEVNPRIKGKEDFQEDYDNDPDEAASMYECKPTRATDAYFRNPVIFDQAVDSPTQPISVDYEVKSRPSEITGAVTRGWEPVFTFSPDFHPVQGARYAMHGDLAIKGDRAGIAMSHVEKWVERWETVTDETGFETKVLVTVPVIRNDFTISFGADSSAKDSDGSNLPLEIQIRWAHELAFQLIKRGFWIGSFTFDGFQSASTIQTLLMHGIESFRVSTDRDPDIWKTLKDVASGGTLRMPFNQHLRNELEALSRVGGGKVDHPPSGSKDEADAFACSIVGAIALGGEEDPAGEIAEVGMAFFDVGAVLDSPLGMGGYNFDGSGGFELPIGMKGMSHSV